MKVHRILCEAVLNCVREVMHNHKSTARSIAKITSANKSWGKRDRTFISNTTFTIIRYYRLYHTVINASTSDDYKNTEWLLIALYLIDQEVEWPKWLSEYITVSKDVLHANLKTQKEVDPLRLSYPDWLYNKFDTDHEYPKNELLAHLNKKAPIFIRYNALNIGKDLLQQTLEEQNIECKSIGQSGFQIHSKRKLTALDAYRDGWFEIQDLGSQMISEFVDPQLNEVVIDACAGAGGKTLHLNMLMQNTGRIIAMDIEENKLQELILRANRNRAFNLDICLIEDTSWVEEYENTADKLLLDVPCSGTGVIRRKPETKWQLNKEKLEMLLEKQQKILQDYTVMVKPRGHLIYATCSLLPSENKDQVKTFLDRNSNYKLIEEKTLYPSTAYQGDGFYMAKLQRTEN